MPSSAGMSSGFQLPVFLCRAIYSKKLTASLPGIHMKRISIPLMEYVYSKVIWQICKEKLYYLVLALYLLITWEGAELLNTIFSSLVSHS